MNFVMLTNANGIGSVMVNLDRVIYAEGVYGPSGQRFVRLHFSFQADATDLREFVDVMEGLSDIYMMARPTQ